MHGLRRQPPYDFEDSIPNGLRRAPLLTWATPSLKDKVKACQAVNKLDAVSSLQMEKKGTPSQMESPPDHEATYPNSYCLPAFEDPAIANSQKKKCKSIT
jgi:hypothetical protein